jgi:hypothetical protein
MLSRTLSSKGQAVAVPALGYEYQAGPQAGGHGGPGQVHPGRSGAQFARSGTLRPGHQIGDVLIPAAGQPGDAQDLAGGHGEADLSQVRAGQAGHGHRRIARGRAGRTGRVARGDGLDGTAQHAAGQFLLAQAGGRQAGTRHLPVT